MPYPAARRYRVARQGDETKSSFFPSKPGENSHNMSFSGLKTAALNLDPPCRTGGEEPEAPALCAAFSAGVSDTLSALAVMALEQTAIGKLPWPGALPQSPHPRDTRGGGEAWGGGLAFLEVFETGDNHQGR